MAFGPKTYILWMFVIWKAYIPWMSFHDKTLHPLDVVSFRRPPSFRCWASATSTTKPSHTNTRHYNHRHQTSLHGNSRRRVVLVVLVVVAKPKRMWYYIVCSRLHTRPYLLDMWCGGKPGLTVYISLSHCLFQAAHPDSYTHLKLTTNRQQ